MIHYYFASKQVFHQLLFSSIGLCFISLVLASQHGVGDVKTIGLAVTGITAALGAISHKMRPLVIITDSFIVVKRGVLPDRKIKISSGHFEITETAKHIIFGGDSDNIKFSKWAIDLTPRSKI